MAARLRILVFPVRILVEINTLKIVEVQIVHIRINILTFAILVFLIAITVVIALIVGISSLTHGISHG